MGVYRRKNKAGDYYGPWIIQYASGVATQTGRVKYTCEKAGHSKRVADLAFAKKTLEWDKKKHLGLETKKEYTFRELVDWYLTLPKVKQKKSFTHDMSRITILKEEFGNLNVRQIKPAMVETFQHNILQRKSVRTGKQYAPATANRILEILKRIFNLAMREDMTEKNPCWKVSKLPENNKRDRVISHEEFQIIIDNLPKYAADIVATAYYTGMRAGEIFNLTWKKVNMDQRYISLFASDTKTSEPRRIPLNDDLVQLFSEIRKVRHLKHDNVFTYKGKPVKNIKRSFNTACTQAEVEDFRFHDLRHTFNTNMRKAGVDRSIIMKITGHKTMSMFERYNTIDSDDALDAMKRYDEFLHRPAPGKESTAILLQAP
jgi:integrase